MLNADPNHTQLAADFTVAQYEWACAAKDRDAIADALRRRFRERYIEPLTSDRPHKMHGFTIMAVCCLMVESLESFRQGWEDTKGKGKRAFDSFFKHHNQFAELRGQSGQFWKHVRCGILHQAETTGGWRITRKKDAPLLNTTKPYTVNAARFLHRLQKVLDSFCDD
jgi:hypothetical protein